MIQITNPEQIKKSGEFKIDGLHVKRFHFELQPEANAPEELTVELVPFGIMDSGEKIHDLTKTYKIVITDLQGYLAENPDFIPTVGGAYFATEMGIVDLLNQKHPELQAVFIPPPTN